MLENVKGKAKKLVEEYKVPLLISGCTIGAIAIGVVVGKSLNKDLIELAGSLQGKDAIVWEPKDSFINLERVKRILDANAENTSRFAIFREGSNPNDYVCVLLSDDVIIPA